MDTISRENNSYLPVAGVLVGVIAIVLSVVALAKVSSAKKDILAQVEPLSARIDEAESQARNATTAAETASRGVTKLGNDTQNAFTQVATELGNIRGEIVKVQEAKVAPKAGAKSTGPVTAGPDEYIIKSGDTFAKIARAQGATLADVQTVNPGVDPSKLKVGQKIKLPAKK
jgi:LysM repeat protein